MQESGKDYVLQTYLEQLPDFKEQLPDYLSPLPADTFQPKTTSRTATADEHKTDAGGLAGSEVPPADQLQVQSLEVKKLNSQKISGYPVKAKVVTFIKVDRAVCDPVFKQKMYF